MMDSFDLSYVQRQLQAHTNGHTNGRLTLGSEELALGSEECVRHNKEVTGGYSEHWPCAGRLNTARDC